MAIIRPFNALRPVKNLAAQVASRPYDVLNSAEARAEAADNPYSFYHISKSEIDLPEGSDIHGSDVYEKAADNLRKFIAAGTLIREGKPCYYIYKLVMPLGEAGEEHIQTGLVAVSAISDYHNGIIKKHEFTRPEKEQDRINHIRSTGAQTGNVFLAYNDVYELSTLTEQWKAAHAPEYDFTAEDGIRHTLWVVDDTETIDHITRLFTEKVPFTYIADGHHRAASAAKVQEQDPDPGDEAAQYFLTTLFPAGDLTILDYNRLVKDLNGLTPQEFLSGLEYSFGVTDTGHTPVKPAMLHEFGMYLSGRWYRLLAHEGTYETDPVGILDVSILQKNVLDKLLGIKDPRTDTRIDFVGGIRGLGELVKRVNSGEMQVAFALHPVTIRQLFDIADSGQVMPPKSTWFEPKLRDGLLTHLIRPA
ncbi:DUF1015 domain-containing protein [Compostibacter hankyongensis]|uniref:DUF1015 domain-containing protein n=1 Tax=Compostibacter hankyongensis TaxID=1007089 RepID=A0ABP8FG86_9BACT